jgi:hypothetical protein
MTFCEQCGTRLDEGARFCVNCGARTTNNEATIVRTQNIVHKSDNQTIKSSTTKSSNKRTILAVIGGLVILFVVLYSVGSGTGNTQQNKETTAAQTQVNITDINLYTLLNEIENNKARANQLYNNKTLRLTGVATNISEDSLWLAVSSAEYWKNILVYFNPTEKTKLLNLNQGQRITIRGVYDGGYYMAVIRRAVIETN